jgi:prepilin-type N-terminal cleavage/methylation domain-containing protein
MTTQGDSVGIAGAARCSRGFSMVEIIVVVLILAIVSTLALQLFISGQSTAQTSTTNQLVLQMAARKAADELMGEVRKGTDIVRPMLGETTPYLVYKNIKNRLCFVYLIKDEKRSAEMKKVLYKVMHCENDYSGVLKPENSKTLADLVSRLSFSLRTPTSVQIVITLANEKQDSQFITQVSVMNLGDIGG